jgi:beta-xylosidase
MKLSLGPLAALVLIGACSAPATSNLAAVSEADQVAGDGGSPDAGQTFANPVAGAGADPGVLRVGDEWLMVTTSGSSGNALPVRASRDLVHWRDVGPVMPRERWPSWATGDFWAPELHRVGERHVAFFTARWKKTQKPSVGIAWTADLDRWARGEIAWDAVVWKTAAEPLAADDRPIDPALEDLSGMIDPTYAEDDEGRPFVFWKRDLWTNKPDGVWRHESELYAQPLAVAAAETDPWVRLAPGTTRTTVLRITLPWEADVVEGPFVVKRDGWFHLVYSANRYWEGKYVVSDARARSILGPYEKLGTPILASGDAFKGPGHGSIVTKDGRDWFVYHAYAAGAVGNEHQRLLMLDPVTWTNGWPRISDGTPSSGPRPAP